jgi:hypothetical protein
MPWGEVSREEGRDLAKNWRPMAVAFVQVRRPQQYYCEDLVLAEAMRGFAERVVCETLAVLHSCSDSRSRSLPIMILG